MSSNAGVFMRLAKLAALASLAVLLMLLHSIASAQEPTGGSTPVATIAASTSEATPATPTPGGPTATPDLSIKTVVRIEVVDPGPFNAGREFEARVLVDNVDHMAGFSWAISYDPKRLEPVKASGTGGTVGPTPALTLQGDQIKGRAIGEFLSSSARASGMFCAGPAAQNNEVQSTCVTNNPPVCLGGPAGPSGSGLLGAVAFKSKGGGKTTLTLSTSELVADDVEQPCDPADLRTVSIPNRQQNAEVVLTGGNSSSTMLYIIIAVIVVVVGVGGAGGYLWYRNRQPTAGPP